MMPAFLQVLSDVLCLNELQMFPQQLQALYSYMPKADSHTSGCMKSHAKASDTCTQEA